MDKYAPYKFRQYHSLSIYHHCLDSDKEYCVKFRNVLCFNRSLYRSALLAVSLIEPKCFLLNFID